MRKAHRTNTKPTLHTLQSIPNCKEYITLNTLREKSQYNKKVKIWTNFS